MTMLSRRAFLIRGGAAALVGSGAVCPRDQAGAQRAVPACPPPACEIALCTDDDAPRTAGVAAARPLAEENPRNCLPSREPGFRPQLVFCEGVRWRNGRTILVSFLDGDAAVHRRVEAHAHEWSRHANITLRFVPHGRGEIRIAFRCDRGNWSALGAMALLRPRDDPTMNFARLRPRSPDEDYAHYVLHEFGHALGCIHEHQSPEARIPWDREAVYTYYGGCFGWERAKVDANVFDRYGRSQTQFTAFDPTSIMQYAVPRELTGGQFEIPRNTALSATDKTFIRGLYPGAPG